MRHVMGIPLATVAVNATLSGTDALGMVPLAACGL